MFLAGPVSEVVCGFLNKDVNGCGDGRHQILQHTVAGTFGNVTVKEGVCLNITFFAIKLLYQIVTQLGQLGFLGGSDPLRRRRGNSWFDH